MLMSTFTGITISKDNLIMNKDQVKVLDSLNIEISHQPDHYILYYKPAPYTEDTRIICHLKGILSRVRSDQIYNAYNNDFGCHHAPQARNRIRPLIKIKMNS
jgi:hypothetical protein